MRDVNGEGDVDIYNRYVRERCRKGKAGSEYVKRNNGRGRKRQRSRRSMEGEEYIVI